MDYPLFTSIKIEEGWNKTTHIETKRAVCFNISKRCIHVAGINLSEQDLNRVFSDPDFFGTLSDVINEHHYNIRK